MTTNHLTLALPLKSPADAVAVAERLPAAMPEFFAGLDSISTVHYSRFTLLSDKTLIYLVHRFHGGHPQSRIPSITWRAVGGRGVNVVVGHHGSIPSRGGVFDRSG